MVRKTNPHYICVWDNLSMDKLYLCRIEPNINLFELSSDSANALIFNDINAAERACNILEDRYPTLDWGIFQF